MGTCDCGQPTVWNDMCQDCNSKWEDGIYSYDDPVERAPVKDTFFSDDVLGLHIDLRSISGVTALDKNYDFYLIYPNGATIKIVTIGPDFQSIKDHYGLMIKALKEK